MQTLSLFLAQDSLALDPQGGTPLLILAIALVVATLMLVSGWKLFEKAGEPGWASLVPIYNMVVLLRIVALPWWCLGLFVVPAVNVAASLMVSYRLAKAFGQGVLGSVGMVLFPFIMLPALGFGQARYTRP